MDWITNLFAKKPAPADIARDRLKLVLMHDRVNCTTDSASLEMLKNDILKVISSYFEMGDGEDFDIQISNGTNENNESVPVLYANIPIKKMRARPLHG